MMILVLLLITAASQGYCGYNFMENITDTVYCEKEILPKLVDKLIKLTEASSSIYNSLLHACNNHAAAIVDVIFCVE